MPAGSSAVRLWIMDSRDYMVLARFWLVGQRLSRSASQTYGRHIIRFKAWCEASNVEPLALLLSGDLVRYYTWMERKPFAERTIKHNEKVFGEFRGFLLEVPADIANRSG
jgi:site-specific recombinase XerD